MKAFPGKSTTLPAPGQALPGRTSAAAVPAHHFVNRRPLAPPYPAGLTLAWFGMGCFWGAERLFWRLAGVYTTAVGYAGGQTPNPTYEEVCSGGTGHAEVVCVTFDPSAISFREILEVFFVIHDPTTLNRQGNDAGTQYRSGLYTVGDAQAEAARAFVAELAAKSAFKGRKIVTEIEPAQQFSPAEEYHQRYLERRGLAHCHLP